MHLVDDVDLVLADRRQIGYLVAQVADVINAVVRRGVHLDDVHDGAGVNALTNFTLAAGVGAGGVQAVDRLGKDLGAGRLAGAAGAGEQIRMADAPGRNLVLQGRDDGRLANHVRKALGTPFSIQGTVHRLTSCKATKTAGRARGCAALRTDAGLTAAPGKRRLMLLGSPPDMVHRLPARGTCICTRNSAIQPCPLLVLYNKFGINASVILHFGYFGHLGHQSSCRRWTIL